MYAAGAGWEDSEIWRVKYEKHWWGTEGKGGCGIFSPANVILIICGRCGGNNDSSLVAYIEISLSLIARWVALILLSKLSILNVTKTWIYHGHSTERHTYYPRRYSCFLSSMHLIAEQLSPWYRRTQVHWCSQLCPSCYAVHPLPDKRLPPTQERPLWVEKDPCHQSL